MISHPGNNLIFLISQPRAGSTLLQRILAGHPLIHSTAEPWIMLPLAYAIRPTGHNAEYNSRLSQKAILSFCNSLDGGDEHYFEGVRRMAAYLYNTACYQAQKPLFLDKTPRYYLIIPQLAKTFPGARFILLLRNPLAVLASIVETWIQEQWILLTQYRQDLLEAPSLLLAGQALLGSRAYVVHYEDLVAHPESTIQDLCVFLDVDYMPGLLDYGERVAPQSEMGDPTGIHRFTKPSDSRIDRCIEQVITAQGRHLLENYLRELGPDTLASLGYNYDHLADKLSPCTPVQGKVTITWNRVFDEKSPLLDRRFWAELALMEHRRLLRWMRRLTKQ